MLIWKKNKTGDIATDQSDGTATQTDLTWLGHIASLEEAQQLAQQIQATTLNSSSTTATSSSAAASSSPTATSSASSPSTSTSPASSADANLTDSGSFGSVGNALFLTSQVQPAGTGVFDTFVQIQANGTEQGYNTGARPQQFDEKSSANHNRSLLLSNIPVVFGDGSGGTNDGTAYREFLLDANEANGGGKNLLSLDRLQIFQELSGNLTGFTPGTGFSAAGQNLVYDLDAGGDHWIALNAGLSSGSGQSDMRLLIPDVLFDHSKPYVVVYSGFGYQGNGWTTDGGFEEWGVDTAHSAGGGSPFALDISKTATIDGGTANAASEVITYAISLANTGSSPLTGITVTDPSVSDLTYVSGDTDADNVLDVGETWSYSAHHTVTQNEIDTSSVINNTATADSNETGPDTAGSAVVIDHNPHATFTKQAAIVGGAVVQAGGVIHYQFTATNDGNITLTNPVVNDPQFTTSTPLNGSQAWNQNTQVFTPIFDGDYNLGDTDNDGIEEPNDHNGVADLGETFQYVYRGDTDQNGRHDPGETWTAINLGDANNNGIRESGETWVGDVNNNGIEDNSEKWQFKNLGDTNSNNQQDPGETWQSPPQGSSYANAGDTNQNGVEDAGETFQYFYNVGDTNQNGAEDSGETFQYYNAGDTNHNGFEDGGETFQYIVTNDVTGIDTTPTDGFNDGDTNLDGKLSVGEIWKYTASYTSTQADIDNRDSEGIPTFNAALTHENTAILTVDQSVSETASESVPIDQNPEVFVTKAVSSITSTDDEAGTTAVDEVGDVINYTVTVENTGNMTLTGVTVNDALVPGWTYQSGDDGNGELDLGETWTYTGSHEVTQAEIDNGGTFDAGLLLHNTASAGSTQTVAEDDPAATASASVPIDQNPGVVVTKALSSITSTDEELGTTMADAAGDIINYEVTVENTGNMTLTALMVTDPLVTEFSRGADVVGNNDAVFDRHEIWAYTGAYTVQQSDIDNDGVLDDNLQIINTAFAGSAETVAEGDPAAFDSASVPVDQNPALAINKSADVASVDAAGDVINYTITVDNTGNMTLTGVTLADPLLQGPNGTLNGTPTESLSTNGVLDVGETWTYTGTYTAQQSHFDNNGGGDGDIDNTATADSNQTISANASDAVLLVTYSADASVDEAAQKLGTDEVINGSGIPADHYGLARVEGAGLELGMQVHYRQGPTVLATDGNGYGDGVLQFVLNDGPQSTANGSQQDVANRAAWNFDYSIATGLNGETTDVSDFTFELSVDVDPSSGTDYQVFTMTPGGTGSADVTWTNQFGDAVVDDAGIAGIVAQNSRNLAFYDTDHGTSGTQPYDTLFGPGEFDVILRAYQGAQLLAQNHIHVDVV
jgi:uncharacterized repeat protein (TIGR01451 family)